MPAAKQRYYTTAEVKTILGCSRSYANKIMHMFEKQGKLYRIGKLMRVEIKDFNAWLEDQRKTR